MAEKGPDDAPEPQSAVRDEVHERPAEPGGSMPLWAVRMVAIGLTLSLVAVVGFQIKNRLAPPGPPVAAVPDQHVVITAQKNLRLTVKVDDQAPVERVLANGDAWDVTGRDRVQVDVPAVEAVKIQYNGELILPQGRQDEPRTLVFVDDLGT